MRNLAIWLKIEKEFCKKKNCLHKKMNKFRKNKSIISNLSTQKILLEVHFTLQENIHRTSLPKIKKNKISININNQQTSMDIILMSKSKKKLIEKC
jgi:hypothetical protein